MRSKILDEENWRDWFAWYPIQVGDELVWLEKIQRRWNPNINLRCIHPEDRGDYHGGWEYRNVKPEYNGRNGNGYQPLEAEPQSPPPQRE